MSYCDDYIDMVENVHFSHLAFWSAPFVLKLMLQTVL